MEKAIFLDRDGTLNVEKDYLYKKEDFEWEYKVIPALKIFYDLGYKLIVITNQSGIARGYYTEEDLKELNYFLINNLKKERIELTDIFYCPHHEKGIGEYKKNCKCRKPGIELFENARKKYNIDYSQSYMIGDKVADLESAIRLGVKPILVKTGHGKEELNKIYFKTEIYENLYDFAIKINK